MTASCESALRRRISNRCVLILTICSGAVPGWCTPPQQEPQNPKPPYVSIGEVEGSPGASLMIPVYFTPHAEAPIRSFAVDIEYVSNNLQFQEIVKGIVDPDELELSSSLTAGDADSKGVVRSKLHLSARLKEGSAAVGISEGLLAYVLFTLSTDAKPFVIRLTPTVVSADGPQQSARRSSSLGAQSGTVTVLSLDAAPEMTCFFFTH